MAIIEADAARHFLHIGTHRLAEIGDLVDEGDLVARKAFAAYLMSSDVRRPVKTSGAWVKIEGPVDRREHIAAALVFRRRQMRSGRLKSLMARAFAQEFRVRDHGNLEFGRTSFRMRSTSSPVPTGTVDFVMTTQGPVSARPNLAVASNTYCRSAWPSPRREGVPTAMNTASTPFTEAARSVEKNRRLSRRFLETTPRDPARKSHDACSRRSIFEESLSMQMTVCRNPQGRHPKRGLHNPIQPLQCA